MISGDERNQRKLVLQTRSQGSRNQRSYKWLRNDPTAVAVFEVRLFLGRVSPDTIACADTIPRYDYLFMTLVDDKGRRSLNAPSKNSKDKRYISK